MKISTWLVSILLIFVTLSFLKTIKAQTTPIPPQVCGIYVNTSEITIPNNGTDKFDASGVIDIPIPPGAIGIDSWQIGTEMKPGTEVRAVIFIRVGSNFIAHHASRVASQGQFSVPNHPILFKPGDTVTLVARFHNESPTDQIAKGNAWVYFLMGEH